MLITDMISYLAIKQAETEVENILASNISGLQKISLKIQQLQAEKEV